MTEWFPFDLARLQDKVLTAGLSKYEWVGRLYKVVTGALWLFPLDDAQ